MGGAGIRSSENMNKCQLAKLGWHLLTCREEVWCQVVREKYGLKEGIPPNFKHKQHESHIWKGVVWGSELLRDGLRWNVRNGRSVYFWSDCWIGDDKLINQRLIGIDREELKVTVGSMWQEHQGWVSSLQHYRHRYS